MANNILQLVQEIAHKLAPIYSNTATQHAWWLLSAVTRQSQPELLSRNTIALSSEQQQQLHTLLDQLINKEMPFAYAIGTIPFNDLEILIKPPILIPRPETEEWCIALSKKLSSISGPLTILDLCTGSGCIALTLAHALPHAQLYGIDINKDALDLARKNAEHNAISNVTWILSDLFSSTPKTLTFDLIVSNPPYISESEWQTLDKSVKNWEDTQALISEQEGLGILSKIIEQGPMWITPNDQLKKNKIPQLTVEIGYQQGKPVEQLFQRIGFNDIQINKDLAQHDRTVSGRVDHVAISKKV